MTPSLRSIAAWIIAALTPVAAAAQAAPPATPSSQGPMIIERVHSGFLFAPDVKITEVDHKTSELVGGYAGWVADEAFFFGGGGYWLANNASGRRMAYGGLMLQWLGQTNRRIGWAAKGLIGGGEATLSDTVTELTYVPNPAFVPGVRRGDVSPVIPGPTRSVQVHFRQDFFVAEPEANIVLRLSKNFRLTGGFGYRAVDARRHQDDRLSGPVGSVAFQIGGGF